MTSTPDEQRIIDAEHLRALRIAYFVSAGTAAFIACFGLFYVFLGTFFRSMLASMPADADAGEFPGAFFALFGIIFFIIAATAAALRFYVGRCLQQRKHLVFCQVVAAVSCLDMPWGTALGIVTFIVLSRPSVNGLFARAPEPVAPPGV
ncbi:MAG TPA: hypothetical protein VF247_06295 [Candidatus Krumholzibacteria bacterium]